MIHSCSMMVHHVHLVHLLDPLVLQQRLDRVVPYVVAYTIIGTSEEPLPEAYALVASTCSVFACGSSSIHYAD